MVTHHLGSSHVGIEPKWTEDWKEKHKLKNTDQAAHERVTLLQASSCVKHLAWKMNLAPSLGVLCEGTMQKDTQVES